MSHREYYDKNKEKIKERWKEYREINKEAIKKQRKKYYSENREKISKQEKEYHKINKEKIKKYEEKYYEINKEVIKEQKREYYRKNKKVILERLREYKKRKWRTDPFYRFRLNLRSRTRQAFSKIAISKSTKTETLLGADYKIVMEYINSLFIFGMSWENRGEWEVDHIVPLASAKTKEELIKLCHYKNLQPLWKKDNRSKRAKMDYKLVS